MAPTRVGILTVSDKVMKFDATSRMCITFPSCSGEENCSVDPVFNRKYTIFPVKGIVSRCRGENALVLYATADDNETQRPNKSRADSGNLSLNWFDELPDGEVSVGDN
ncbi:hypothetical protein KRP22_005814 [Phytophthora ramorum]|nr:hypothetical protein KRP22_3054 [Phytophthora ramorum]